MEKEIMAAGIRFKQRAYTDHIVVHCSATEPSSTIDRAVIAQWHRLKGWLDIGYHFVIKTNGDIETGRELNAVGAHVKGHNSTSVGICMVGGVNAKGEPENNFTKAQFDSLRNLLMDLKIVYPDATIVGHRDFAGVNKACPSFDVREWLAAPHYKGTKNIVVAKGDTLWSIANKYGSTVADIKAYNDLDTDTIIIGDILKVPFSNKAN
jgi:N-acetylmuramoyl-L-alanine amidase